MGKDERLDRHSATGVSGDAKKGLFIFLFL